MIFTVHGEHPDGDHSEFVRITAAGAVFKAADLMDKAGNKAAKAEIAMIKVKAPRMALKIIDDAIQAFGGAGVSQDTSLAHSWAGIRTLRLADGPDEVHNRAIALIEYGKHPPIDPQVP